MVTCVEVKLDLCSVSADSRQRIAVKARNELHKTQYIPCRCDPNSFPLSHQETNILRFAPSFSPKVFYCFGVSHKFRTHSERKIRTTDSRLRENWCVENAY